MRRLIAIAAAAMVPAATMAPATADVPPRDHVQVLAINDLHGNLAPPTPGAGGTAYLAARLNALRQGHGRSITVGAGDLIGGSPLVSSLFGDSPTIEALDAMGLQVSALGNHELDRGRVHVERLARGARFDYVAANTRVVRTGRRLFPAARIENVGGVRVGFIGVTLRGTKAVTAPGGTAGLRFGGEAAAVRKAAARLRSRGARAVIVLLHEGGEQHPAGALDPNGCERFSGRIVGIVTRIAGTVDAVASAHTHGAYVCEIAGVPVTSAGSYGKLVTEYDIELDRRTHRVREVSARNVEVGHDIAPDPVVQSIVDDYTARAAPVAARVVGSAAESLNRKALGAVIADAEQAAVPGADVALMNPGGVRADLDAGTVTYADVFEALPFGYRLEAKTLTGAQLRDVLEAQYRPGKDVLLSASAGLTYSAAGGEVTELALNGVPIAPADRVRVVANAFLAAGNDKFPALREGRDTATGPGDIDAVAQYFGARSPVSAR